MPEATLAEASAEEKPRMAPTDSASHEAGVSALRSLLSSPEPEYVEQLEERIRQLEALQQDKPLRTEQVSEVIAEAVHQRNEKDDRLGDALRPMVETQFHKAARENVDFMAEALFPILGPAVRKLVSELISPENESARSRVEQFFLIDNPSGLPISHVILDGTDAQDADMVGGMLSAINSYVNDAFNADKFDGLDHLQVGELAVWVEWGPQAILAAVVRGAAPENLRVWMQTTLENTHRHCADTLKDYDGTSSGKESIDNEMSALLSSCEHASTQKERKRHYFGSLLGISACLLISYLAYSLWDSSRWNEYIQSISSESGLVILEESRGLSGYTVRGLRDPLASDPNSLLEDSRLTPGRVAMNWTPFSSLEPDIVLRRARKIMQPPPSVFLSMQGQTLWLTGDNDMAWLDASRSKVLALAGIENIRIKPRKTSGSIQ